MLYSNDEHTIIDKILHEISNQAKHYLEEFDEFYPFSSVLDDDKKLKPFAIYEGDQRPDVRQYFEKLIEELNNRYSTYGIGINTTVDLPDGEMDAIQIRIVVNDQQYEDCFIPYKKENNQYIYYDLFTDQ